MLDLTPYLSSKSELSALELERLSILIDNLVSPLYGIYNGYGNQLNAVNLCDPHDALKPANLDELFTLLEKLSPQAPLSPAIHQALQKIDQQEPEDLNLDRATRLSLALQILFAHRAEIYAYQAKH